MGILADQLRERFSIKKIGDTPIAASLRERFGVEKTPSVPELLAQKAEIRRVPTTFAQKIFSKLPAPVQKAGMALKKGLFGRGMETAGLPAQEKQVFDTGLIGFLRPFGIGKPAAQKVTERLDLLKPLVDAGKITQSRANTLATESIKPRGFEVMRAQTRGVEPTPEPALSSEEKRALRPVVIEETLDKIFGALDFVSLGTMKPITRTAAQRIAKSKIFNEIADILIKEVPGLERQTAETMGRVLVNIDNADDVQAVINRTEFAVQEARKARVAERAVPEAPAVAPRVIAPELEPLTQEARKYKSAEEFVRAQGTPLYFGSGADFKPSIGVEGLPTTVDKKVAESFAGGFKTPIVNEVFLDPNANIVKFEELPNEFRSFPEGIDAIEKAARYAKNKGYDAIDMRGFGKALNPEAEIRIFNPEVLKTKSQLIDFWERAMRGAAEEAPAITKQKDGPLIEKAMRQFLEKKGLKINPDNTVTLYHATLSAEEIKKSGIIRPSADGLAYTTQSKERAKKIWGKDRDIVEIKVPVSEVRYLPSKGIDEIIGQDGFRKQGNVWHPVSAPSDDVLGRLAIKKFAEIEPAVLSISRIPAERMIEPAPARETPTLAQIEELGKRAKELARAGRSKEKIAREIEQFELQASFVEENIDQMPGKKLQKFISRKEGEFLDFKEPDLAKTPAEKQRIIEQNKRILRGAETAFEGTAQSDLFDDPDTIRKAIEDYQTARTQLADLKKTVADLRKESAVISKVEAIREIRGVPELDMPVSQTPVPAETTLRMRKDLVKELRDRFGLTDADLRAINDKDFRLMDNHEFKRYIDALDQKAFEMANTTKLKLQLLDLRRRMNFKREEAYRASQNFPPVEDMSSDELSRYIGALSQYQFGDEFLTQRTLEVVDRTSLRGVRTVREARLHLLEEVRKMSGMENATINDISNVDVSAFDQFRFDTSLAEKNPFYKLLVERTQTHILSGDARYLEVQRKIDDLAVKARKSRPRGIKDTIAQFLVPQHEEMIRYLEAPIPEKIGLAQKLTKEELNYVHYVEQYYDDAYAHLVAIKELRGSRFVDKYFTHTRKRFIESWKDDGFVDAVRGWYVSHKEDQVIANIIDQDTGNILPKAKFFQFTLRRSGALEPSKNLTQVFLNYAKIFERKKMFDQMIPEVEIYTEALSPLDLTPRGLEMDRRLKTFVKKYLNNKKGRRETFGGTVRQFGPADMMIRMGNTFVSLMDLGFNIGANIAASVGEQVMTYQALGKIKYATAIKRRLWDTGALRLKDKNAVKILTEAEPFIGRNLWTELAETDKGFGDKAMQAIWGLFRQSSVEANKLFLLGSLTPEELAAGKISAQRMAQLRLEAGRWRDMGRDIKSVVGATSIGEMSTKYKGWAIPILFTNATNLITTGKRIWRLEFGAAIHSREAAEIYRAVEMTAVLLFVGSYVLSEEKDETFLGKLKARAYQEALTVLGGTDPTLFLSTPRLFNFIQTLGVNIVKIAKLEKYQQDTRFGEEGELTGVKGIQRQFTPALVRQFGGKEPQKKRSTVGLQIPQMKVGPGGRGLLKIPELK